MGRNKAFLEMSGRPLIERSLEVLNRVCSEVFISCREADLYKEYDYPVIPDKIKDKGPLGGLYSILSLASNEYVFLTACDMPFLNEEAIRYIYQELDDYKLVIPFVNNKKHMLHAFYHKSLMPLVEKNMKEDNLSLLDLQIEGWTKILKIGEDFKGEDKEKIEESFLNVNTPQEWEIINRKLNRDN